MSPLYSSSSWPDRSAGSIDRIAENTTARCFIDGPLGLRIERRTRTIECVVRAVEAGGSPTAVVEDALQWPVFRCASGTAETVRAGPEAGLPRTEVPAAQWPCVRRIRCALFAELPVELRGWLVRLRFPWLSFHDIGQLWRAMDVLRPVARDNVRLLALWLCLPISANGTQMARKSLREEYGVSTAVWKALRRHGWRLFPACVMHDSMVARRIGAQAYLGLIGADRIDGVMRSDTKRELWRLAASAPAVFRRGGDLPRAVLRHVRAALAAGRPIDGASLACTIIDIDLHLERLHPDPNQRRAGWPWWLRQWQALDTGAGVPACDEAWGCPVDSFICGDTLVMPLRDPAALRDEGRRMRTCLAARFDEYAQRCRKRGVRLYSLRHRSVDGAGRGTVTLALDGFGNPLVEESAGHANGALPERLAPVIDELLRRYREAEAQLPLAQARRKRVAALGRDGHGIARVQAGNADPRAIVSFIPAVNEWASLTEIVRKCISRYVIDEGHSVLLLHARSCDPLAIGLPSSMPMHLANMRGNIGSSFTS